VRVAYASQDRTGGLVMSASSPDEVSLFRDAMSSFPSGVTIVTTADADRRWWGFTATSFCSVSMDPPLVLVCLARSAECFSKFEQAAGWIVHIIHPQHTELATLFATRGADKFGGGSFAADENGLPVLDQAGVTLRCSSYAKVPGGDHLILVGRVEHTQMSAPEIQPPVYFRRTYHRCPHSRTETV
jgi:flavin reductase ActVB